MSTYPLTSLISAFCDKYLSQCDTFCDKSDDFTYFLEGPNTLLVKIDNNPNNDIIFVYNGLNDYKFLTVKCYNREMKALKELRNELSTCQTNFKNYKRSVKK